MNTANKATSPADALDRARSALIGERRGDCWPGELADSALATAVAASALNAVDADRYASLVTRAGDWIADHANADGGWGDTPESPSNLATTLLAWATLANLEPRRHAGAVTNAQHWLRGRLGGLDAEAIAAGLRKRYGRDLTFAGPILAFLAMNGRLGEGRRAWREVPQLPFEAAVLPHSLLRAMRVGVVSYALPALIAVGQARHAHAPGFCPVTRIVRHLLRGLTLGKLARIQPDGGGFLEAAPLSGFVAMSLASAGLEEHPVAHRAARFLARTVRPGGCWPIDTDLSVWLTAHAALALTEGDGDIPNRHAVRAWLLAAQHTGRHPYTQAEPGGWAWTHRGGGVPDADDTAVVLRALHRLDDGSPRLSLAAENGARWLLGLQNADGGMPTFCRGWGRLPFDRSAPELTANALAAWCAWGPRFDPPLRGAIRGAAARAMRFLRDAQRGDGGFLPLWFGSQRTDDEGNPVFGTAHVLSCLADVGPPAAADVTRPAIEFLLATQQEHGGWGAAADAPAGIEETAVAVEALARWKSLVTDARLGPAVAAGAAWLIDRTDNGRRFPPEPIGLYFARLWYSEKLYPRVFTVSALSAAKEL